MRLPSAEREREREKLRNSSSRQSDSLGRRQVESAAAATVGGTTFIGGGQLACKMAVIGEELLAGCESAETGRLRSLAAGSNSLLLLPAHVLFSCSGQLLHPVQNGQNETSPRLLLLLLLLRRSE